MKPPFVCRKNDQYNCVNKEDGEQFSEAKRKQNKIVAHVLEKKLRNLSENHITKITLFVNMQLWEFTSNEKCHDLVLVICTESYKNVKIYCGNV